MASPSETIRTKLLEVSFVIPIYNEGEPVRQLLENLFAAVGFPFQVYLIYDFDEDSTLPAVRAMCREDARIHLVKNHFGRGAINALKTGFTTAQGDAVIVLMGDASDDLRALQPMYDHLQAGSDLVCGSRYSHGGRQIGGPRLKKIMSRAAGTSLHYLIGIPTRDVTNSFKAYRASLLRSIPIQSRAGFEISMEICIKAFLRGYCVSEVPCVWRDRSVGKSRFRMLAWLPHYARWYLYALRRTWFRSGLSNGPAQP